MSFPTAAPVGVGAWVHLDGEGFEYLGVGGGTPGPLRAAGQLSASGDVFAFSVGGSGCACCGVLGENAARGVADITGGGVQVDPAPGYDIEDFDVGCTRCASTYVWFDVHQPVVSIDQLVMGGSCGATGEVLFELDALGEGAKQVICELGTGEIRVSSTDRIHRRGGSHGCSFGCGLGRW